MSISRRLSADQGAGWGEARRWAALVAWEMWVVGIAAILASAFLAVRNPPPSTIEQVSLVESLIWLSSWVGFGFVGALWLASSCRPASPGKRGES